MTEDRRIVRGISPLFWCLASVVCLLVPAHLLAQENAPGPLAPPPEHRITRIEGMGEPPAPPSLPPAEIIQAFTKKEETYQAIRPQFSYRKTIRIEEFGPDGRPSGEYDATYETARSGDGKLYEKAISAPQSSLQYLTFEPEDAQALTRIPQYPATASQLSKYDVKYLNTEKVDEIDCYIFQVSPKTLDRQHPLFDGIVWVDQKYLEVVKTYGKWVTDLGDMHAPDLPFVNFETYRENVEGKYWFPNYSRSDDYLHLKDQTVPVRLVVKWTEMKPLEKSPPPEPPDSRPKPR